MQDEVGAIKEGQSRKGKEKYLMRGRTCKFYMMINYLSPVQKIKNERNFK